MLDEYKPGLAAHGITLHYTQPALADIVAESSTKYGARELRRSARPLRIPSPTRSSMAAWMAARSRWSWPTTTAVPCWKFKGRTMYRKLAALVLAAVLLCSCSTRVTVQRYPAELPRAESPAATPTPEPVPTFTEEQKAYGGATADRCHRARQRVFERRRPRAYLGRREPRCRRAAQLAVDWITEQAAGYEAAVNLICDRSADGSDSTLTRSYLVQSAMQGGENSEESSTFLDEMDTLCASLAADSRLAAYGARHIAFLFFLPISGTSFTMAHYADDGDSFIMNTAACTKPTPTPTARRNPRRPTPTRSCICSARPTCMRGSSDPRRRGTCQLCGRHLPRRYYAEHLRGRRLKPV